MSRLRSFRPASLPRLLPVLAPLAVVACADGPTAPAVPSNVARQAVAATIAVTVGTPTTLAPLASRTSSAIHLVSRTGDYLVGSSFTPGTGTATGVGTAWLPGQAPTTIGGFGFSASPTAGGPYGINAAGQLVGLENVDDVLTAVLWTPAVPGSFAAGTSTRVAPAVLPQAPAGSWFNTTASLIAPDGLVIGWMYPSGGAYGLADDHCFAWIPTAPNATTGTAVTLEVPGGGTCSAYAIARGTDAIGFTRASYDPTNHLAERPGRAFRWTPRTGAFERLFATDHSNVPLTANAAGQIAGGRRAVAGGAWDYYLWTPDSPGASTGTMQSLGGDVRGPVLNDAGHLLFGRARADGRTDPVLRLDGIDHALPLPADATIAEASALSEPVATSPTTVRLVVGGTALSANLQRVAVRWEVTLVRTAPGTATQPAVDAVNQLVGQGALNAGNANAILGKLDAAQRLIARGQTTAARNLLSALLNDISALVASRRLTEAQAQPLVAAIQAAIAAL